MLVRLSKVLIGSALVDLLVAVTLVMGASSAHAVGCGDGSLHFSGGDGSSVTPFLISSESDLVALRDGYTATPSYYSCAYRQTGDITLTSVWPHGIGFSTPGSALFKPFEGTYDGGGYSLTNLVIDALPVARPNQARELGFIGLSTSGSAAVRNLDLVNVTVTCGYETVFAAMLVGEIVGPVERSSATGSVACSAADGLARMGGLVGYADGEVSNAWVSGTITVPTAYTFAPNSIGGAIGKSFSAASIRNVLARVAIVNAAHGVHVGAFAGWSEGTRSGNLAEAGLTAGLATLVGVSSGPLNVSFKSAAELQDITTYVGWSMSAGVNETTVWGIDPAVNGGFPFLQPLAAAVTSDPAQLPFPILQQVPALADGSCSITDDAMLGYGTGLHGGWSASWAGWAHGGMGGPVCTRTLVFGRNVWELLH